METESRRRKVRDAADALRRGDTERALNAADELTKADPANAEAHQIRGIALTRQGDLAGATEAFRQAVAHEPREPKHVYNLAVTLRDRGLTEEARQAAQQALDLDSQHLGARKLLDELEGREARPVDPGGKNPEIAREGYREPKHLLPILDGMEKPWTVLGWGICVADVALAALMIAHLPMEKTGQLMPHSKVPDVQLRHDGLSIFIVFLYIATWICTFMWMFVDIIDLRRRFSWMVPFIACSVLGFTALPFGLYLAVGRRLDESGVS